MKNLYFNSIVKKSTYSIALLAILLGYNNTANAQVEKAFTQRTSQYTPTKKIYNVKGDFTMLGNTCLTPQNYTPTTNNNGQSMIYVDTDGDSSTFNSSSSTLVLSTENGAIPACSNIIYAGLYWTGKSSPNATFNVTKNSVTKTFNKRIVKLKGPTAASYTQITAAANDIWFPSGSDDDIFSAYAEITDYVKTNGIGKYTVADMALLEGDPGGTGYSGGWGIIVVYENSNMKYRDVTIFDGYAYVASTNTSGFDLPVSGFNTVQTGNVGVRLGVMASEGDVSYTGDYFKIRNLNTTNYTSLSHNLNSTTNFFNSSINAGGVRNPQLVNNTGIDIAIIDIPNTNNAIIGNNQTSTNFKYGTTSDTYSIFTIAMSVDAYVPQVEGTLTATSINNLPPSQPYILLPGQDGAFNVDIKNLGSEAINNFKVVVPIPYNATYVAGSATGTILFTPLPTPNSVIFDPTLGATGSIVWNLGTLPLPTNPSTLLAKLTFKLKATTDCSILTNSTCGNTIQANGYISGVGANTTIPVTNMPFIEGYTQNGNCIGQPIPQPLNINIDGVSYVQQNCLNTPLIRNFSYCSTNTTVGTSQIASFFPAGSLFYNQFPVTASAIQYTDANPIPLVAGSTITYYAVPPNTAATCNFQFTISKCPAIIAQNDALTGGNGTAGNANAGNILNNNGSGSDTLNGAQATITQVNITVTTPAVSIGGAPVPTLATTTGQVSVPAGTPAGTYTIVYNLCEKLNPTNCDPATVTITVYTPSIELLKNGTYVDSLAPTGVSVGDTIVYNFTVTNTGGAPLNNIIVTDPLVNVVGGPLASLAAGASNTTTFTATYTITQADIDAGQVNNLATATGTPPSGPPVTDTSTDPTPCTTCTPVPNCPTCTTTPLPQNPSIAITKDGTYQDTTAPFGVTNPGDTVVYNFVVTNTGNVTLTNITVTDINATVTGGPLASLAVGTSDSSTFSATHVITQTDIDAGVVFNLATATGNPPTGAPVTGTSTDPTPCTTCPSNPQCPTCTGTPLIKALDDSYTNIACNVTAITGNILSNDTLGSSPVNTSPATQVTLTILSGNYPNISIANNGDINFTSGVPAGSYTYTYQICSVLVPNICAQATVTINVIDTTPPVMTDASNLTEQCDGNGNTVALQAWLANHGGAAASDTCSNITWSDNFNGLSDGCGNTGTATVIFTATDDSGNASHTSATFTIEDTTAPTIDTAASNVTVQCNGNGNTGALQAWLTSNGGAIASDTCSNVTWSNNFDSLSNDCSVAVTVIFTATDACGNASTTSATFTVEDTTAPTINTVAANATVQCDGNGNTEALQAWLVSNGGAAASDTCTNVTWSNNFDGLSDGCGNTGTATVIFTATDACGNTSNTSAIFTIEDTIAPVAPDTPATITVACAGDVPAMISLTATDNCTGQITVQGVDTTTPGNCPNSFSITRTWTFTDACNNTSSVSQTINVVDDQAPNFNEAVPANTTASCDNVPAPAVMTASDNCTSATVTMTENIIQGNCPSNYQLIRTWTAADACGNTKSITQTINVSDGTGPVLVTDIPLKLMVTCDAIPAVPTLVFTDNCTANVVTPEPTITTSGIVDGVYSIIRTWTATDACGNTTTVIQTVNVTQTTSETNVTVTDQVCNDNETITWDLSNYLPAGTPTGGTWVNESNVGTFNGSIFNAYHVAEASYTFSYNYNNANSCPQKVNVIVPVQLCTVAGCDNVEIHNAFTPNNDGINEWFQIDNIAQECHLPNTVEIYNRWGVLVYETKNYDNSTKKFIGVSEGRVTVSKSSELPTGTYFYIIQWTDTSTGKTVNKDGYLYLTR